MRTIHVKVGITIDADAADTLARLLKEIVGKTGLDRSEKLASGGAASEQKEPPRKMTPREASEHALLGGQELPEDKGLLLSVKQAAKLLNISDRTLWGYWKAGRVPQPIRIGQRVLWPYEELRAWVAAGCPAQEEWKWPERTARD